MLQFGDFQNINIKQFVALFFVAAGEQFRQVVGESGWVADVMATVHDQVLELRYLFSRSLSDTLGRLIFAIKVVLNNIEFLHAENDGLRYDFSEGEIEAANLPFLVTCEKFRWVSMALLYQGYPFLALSGNGEIWKFL